MRISGINNINFRSVTPIITKTGNLPKIEEQLIEKVSDRGFELVDATSMYSSISNDRGSCWEAVNTGKYDVGFLITGKEYQKWVCSAPGWKTLATVAKHLDYNAEAIPNGEVNEKTLEKLAKRISEPFLNKKK